MIKKIKATAKEIKYKIATIEEVQNYYDNINIKEICEDLFQKSFDDYSDQEICNKLFKYNQEDEIMQYANINAISDSFGYLQCDTFEEN